MKTWFQNNTSEYPTHRYISAIGPGTLFLCSLVVLPFSRSTASAGIAYGSINNFDTVNDTSNVCHGFEIELDDLHSTDITYTYDYNHYGTPKISEDNTDPLHPKVFVRYEAIWTNTGWSAYTAVPTTNIPPTQGHAFTNPALNFGGEHFGVGFRTQPSKVYYHWLVDDGNHVLALGPQVNVSTPSFTYNPPVPGGAPAQVIAVIPAPILPPPQVPGFEFSDATWVKEIRTTSHNNNPMELRDLITPDSANPNATDWRNGEPDEVEVEWRLMQIDFNSSDYDPGSGVGGPNGKLAGAAQNVENSDDVVTRRYEYYTYVGPYADWDTHQALAEQVGVDGIHGVGFYTNQDNVGIDLSKVEVVGKFLGAQMSAMIAVPPIGLIDHLSDGEVNIPYPSRSLVIANDTNFTATLTGTLPAGMLFDPSTGWLYGTPSESGTFIVRVTATASNNPVVTKQYPFLIAPSGGVLPPHSSVDTSAFPAAGGTTTGTGVYTNGTIITVLGTPQPGYAFIHWTENGAVVSSSANYSFTNLVNRSLIADFVLGPNPQLQVHSVTPQSFILQWPTNYTGFGLEEKSELGGTNWLSSVYTVGISGANYQVTVPTTNAIQFFRLKRP